LKILYVNPGKIESGLDFVIKGPPLALLSIAAMVPEHNATLYDFKVESNDDNEFRNLIAEHDVVAISSMTPQINHAYKVARLAKKMGKTTIIGGYHPTLAPDEVTKHEELDYIVRGEGEHTFKELIDFISKAPGHLEKEEIKGISYQEKDEHGNTKIIHNEDRPLEPDLDKFPIPRRDLLNKTEYSYMGARVMLMETSRGCPHSCNFCCIHQMWKDDKNKIYYRTKSVKRVMQEIYSIDRDWWDFIFFNDDNFTINVNRTKKILNTIIKSRINHHIKFSCQTRVDTLYKHPELCQLMEDANMRMAFLGIESVHQQSLDKMNKKTNIKMIEKSVEMCKEHGIAVFGGMIIGFPGETVEMVRENIDFARSLDMEFVQFTPITAFPGTPFFEDMKKQGKICTYNYKYYNLFFPMMKTDEINFVDLYKLVAEAYSKYYNNADYLGGMMKRAVSKEFGWFRSIMFRWFKQFAIGGLGMLHQNGITRDIADDLKEKSEGTLTKWRMKLMSKRKRYKLFKRRLHDLIIRMRAQGKQFFQVRSDILRNYLIQQGIENFVSIK